MMAKIAVIISMERVMIKPTIEPGTTPEAIKCDAHESERTSNSLYDNPSSPKTSATASGVAKD